MIDWSIEHRFEEMPVIIDGIQVGEFDGIANLAKDPEYDGFYVASIVLDGTIVERRHGFPKPKRVQKRIACPDACGSRDSLEARIFTSLREQIEADHELHGWFEEQIQMEAA